MITSVAGLPKYHQNLLTKCVVTGDERLGYDLREKSTSYKVLQSGLTGTASRAPSKCHSSHFKLYSTLLLLRSLPHLFAANKKVDQTSLTLHLMF